MHIDRLQTLEIDLMRPQRPQQVSHGVVLAVDHIHVWHEIFEHFRVEELRQDVRSQVVKHRVLDSEATFCHSSFQLVQGQFFVSEFLVKVFITVLKRISQLIFSNMLPIHILEELIEHVLSQVLVPDQLQEDVVLQILEVFALREESIDFLPSLHLRLLHLPYLILFLLVDFAANSDEHVPQVALSFCHVNQFGSDATLH